MPAAQAASQIVGKVTSSQTGEPVPNACVTVVDYFYEDKEIAKGCADATGAFAIDVPGGTYVLRGSAEGYSDTWSGSRRRHRDAVFVYPGTQPYELKLRPPGIGVLRGKLLDGDKPVPWVGVSLVDVDGSIWAGDTSTNAAGEYAFRDVFPGRHKIEFKAYPTQYYHQKETLAEADVVNVLSGPDVVIDEQLIPPGFAEVTLTDEVSGAPVKEFCAFAPGTGGDRPCTTDGVVRLRLPRGTYDLAITPDKAHFGSTIEKVVIRSGEVTKAPGKVKPAVAIRSVVRNARTGALVKNTCVQAVESNSPGLSTWDNNWRGTCSDDAGVVVVGPLPIADYRLLARPQDETHGLQWVGWWGGTGEQTAARTYKAQPGRIVQGSPILLDGAGTVTGTVRDEATGQPIPHVCVFPYATNWAYGDHCTDLQGNYRFPGLGPYHWPLEFTATSGNHGWRWSGNAVDRKAAKRIKVEAGRETTSDETLQAAAKVTGVGLVEGSEDSWITVIPYNARTGDYAGPSGNGYFGDPYEVTGLGTQQVRLRFIDDIGRKEIWYLDAPSFDKATPVQVTSGATTPDINQTIR
ncbi:hypothetical protein Lesp02_82540 [Lentzea sp. NBRC 105346]|nr:hypothetical protein Lesp02_82540 [Lentzea sp. NBRC 105346]